MSVVIPLICQIIQTQEKHRSFSTYRSLVAFVLHFEPGKAIPYNLPLKRMTESKMRENTGENYHHSSPPVVCLNLQNSPDLNLCYSYYGYFFNKKQRLFV